MSESTGPVTPSLAPSGLAARLQPSWGNAKRFLGRGLAVLGGGALLSSLMLAYARYRAQKADASLPDEFVIELDLSRYTIVESAPTSPLAALQPGAANKVELRKLVRALELAGKDVRVKGVVAQLAGSQNLAGIATVQELRAAVQAFRIASSKRSAQTIVHAASFGEAGANGTLPYYLATAFDKVYMQASGQVGLLGVQSQMLFLRGLLDKVKVVPIFYTREDYKTAANMFTQSGYTPQHKENTDAILQSLVSQMWQGISGARGLTTQQLEAAVTTAPLLARPAALPVGKGGYGLVDGLKYRDEVLTSLQLSPAAQEKKHAEAKQKKDAGPPDMRLPRVPVLKYLLVKEVAEAAKHQRGLTGWLSQSPWQGLMPGRSIDATREQAADMAGLRGAAAPLPTAGPRTAEAAGWVPRHIGQGKPKVAVIHAVGAIVQGPVQGPPGPATPAGQQVIDASKLYAQLAKLADARDVAAVVLRVSSPGGSALGSDTLHHALSQLRAAGKHLVVSCGDVAASGGMFMAVAGERIFAQPGTLTGSIGVVTGKVDASGLVQDLGVNPAHISHGSPNLGLQWPFSKPDEKQEQKINELMDDIYDDFLDKVASGRGMTREAVKKLAGGRVYTGEQALQAGLIDELGGLKDAVAAAKRLANLPPEEEKVVVFDYPPKRIPLLLRLLQGSLGSDSEGVSARMDSSQHLSDVAWQLTSWLGRSRPSAEQQASTLAAEGIAGLSGDAAAAAALVMQNAAGAGKLGHMLETTSKVVATACMLEGQVCCYAPDAHMLADTLA